jgi:uncharacterized protein (DUF433 family)
MNLESYFDFSHGEIRIQGSRVYVDDVVRYYKDGLSAEEIMKHLPNLGLEKIYASITYYLLNRQKVEDYIEEKDRDFEEKWQEQERNADPLIQRLKAHKAEYQKKLANGE